MTLIAPIQGVVTKARHELREILDPSSIVDTGIIHTRDDGGDTELFYDDDKDRTTQITKDGALNVPPGVTTFLALTDTPGSFTANRIIHANAAADALVDSDVVIFPSGNLGFGITVDDGLSVIRADRNANADRRLILINNNAGTSSRSSVIANSNVGGVEISFTSSTFTPQFGRETQAGHLTSQVGNLIIHTTANASIKFKTGAANLLRFTIAHGGGDIQGNGGLLIEGGALAGNELTLSSTASVTKGKILFGTSAYDEVNNRLGLATNVPNALLDVRGAPGDVVGGFASGALHVTSPSALINANSVITGHNLFGGNKQLWYLGSVSSSNDNIAFINRQTGSLSLQTSNSLVTLLTGSSNTLQGNAGLKIQGGAGIFTLTLSGGTGLASTLKLQEAVTDILSAYGVAGQAQASKISDPSGGATVDAEARTAINAIIDVLEGIGFSAAA